MKRVRLNSVFTDIKNKIYITKKVSLSKRPYRLFFVFVWLICACNNISSLKVTRTSDNHINTLNCLSSIKNKKTPAELSILDNNKHDPVHSKNRPQDKSLQALKIFKNFLLLSSIKNLPQSFAQLPIFSTSNINNENLNIAGSTTSIYITPDIISSFNTESAGIPYGIISSQEAGKNNQYNWQKKINWTLASGINSINSYSNDIYICGYQNIIDADPFTPSLHTNALILNLESGGNTLDRKIFDVRFLNDTNFIGQNEECKSILTTTDDNLFSIIKRTSNSLNDAYYLSKFDSNYILEFDTAFEISGTSDNPALISESNNFYLFGTSYTDFIYFHIYNQSGAVIESKRIPNFNDTVLYSIKALDDNTFLASLSNKDSIEIWKLQPSLNFDWTKKINLPSNSNPFYVDSSQNSLSGNIYTATSYKNNSGEYGLFISMDNTNGNVIFSNVLSNSSLSDNFKNTELRNIIEIDESFLGTGILSDPFVISADDIISYSIGYDGATLTDCNINNNFINLVSEDTSRSLVTYTIDAITYDINIYDSLITLSDIIILEDEVICGNTTLLPTESPTPTPVSTAQFNETNYISPIRSISIPNNNQSIFVVGDKIMTPSGTNNYAFTSNILNFQYYPEITGNYLFEINNDLVDDNQVGVGNSSLTSYSIAHIDGVGYFSCGTIASSSMTNQTQIIFKSYDTNMDLTNIHVSNNTQISSCNSMITLQNNNIAIGGSTNHLAYIGELDPVNIIFENEYVFNISAFDNKVVSLSQLSDGIIVGSTISDGCQYVVKLDSPIEATEVPTLCPDEPQKVYVLANDKILTIFNDEETGSYRLLVYDSNLNLEYLVEIPLPPANNYITPVSIKESNNQTLIISGPMKKFLYNNGTNDIYSPLFDDGFITELSYNGSQVLFSRIFNSSKLNMTFSSLYSPSAYIADSISIENSLFFLGQGYGLLNNNDSFTYSKSIAGKVFEIEFDQNRNTITECADIFTNNPIDVAISFLANTIINPIEQIFNLKLTELTSVHLFDLTVLNTECGITDAPTPSPTDNPTAFTEAPTRSPSSASPTRTPTPRPTKNPTKNPTIEPTDSPSPEPTKKPTKDKDKDKNKKNKKCKTSDKVLSVISFGLANDCVSGPDLAIGIPMLASPSCSCSCCCYCFCFICCILWADEKKKSRKKEVKKIQRANDQYKRDKLNTKEQEMQAYENSYRASRQAQIDANKNASAYQNVPEDSSAEGSI